MKKTLSRLISSFSLLMLLPAHAQEHMLSFEEALGLTLSQNEALVAHSFEQQAAEHERKATIGLRLPQIGIQGAYAYLGDNIGVDINNLKPMAQQGLDAIEASGISIPPAVSGVAGMVMGLNWGMTIQEREFAFAGATATMPIFLGGKINAANEASRINSESIGVDGEVVTNHLVSELVERYYGYGVARQAVEVRRQVTKAVGVHLNDAKQLEENGMIARGERLLVEVKMSEAERALQGAVMQARTIASALGNTLNDERDFMPVSRLFILNSIEDVAYYKSLAWSNNPQLRKVGLTRDLASQGINLQVSELMPQVALMANYRFYNYQVSKALPEWMVGVGVSFKVFDGLHKEHKVSAAKRTVSQVEALQSKAAKDVGVLVEKLYNEMTDCRNRVMSIDKSLEFAQEYLRIQNASFREGISSASELLDAELNLASIRIEKLQAAYLYDLALAGLLETCGMSASFPDYARRDTAIPVAFHE